MTTQDYINEIRSAVANGSTDKALDTLKEMADTLEEPALMNEHALLNSQYARATYEYRIGTIKVEDFNLIINKINYRILAVLTDFTNGTLLQVVGSERTESGRIVHNIPGKMIPLKSVLCSVRIAKDDKILLQDVGSFENSQPESLPISGEMQVDMEDPSGGENFELARIPPGSGIQRIEYDQFTEWDFRIKPLKQGTYPLWLYASTIIGGKEKKKRFFKNIEISTETTEIEQPWQDTNLIIEPSTPKMPEKRRGIIGWLSSLGAVPLTFIGIVVVSALGYFAYRLFQPELANPVFILDNELLLEKVAVDGVEFQNWKPNADTSEITLNGLEVGKEYTIVIAGENGKCEKKIKVSKQLLLIPMDCGIIPINVQPILLINNKLNVREIKIDNKLITGWTTNNDTTEILLPPIEVDKKYKFEVKGSNGSCTETTLITQNAFGVEMSCMVEPPPGQLPPSISGTKFNIKLRVNKNVLGQNNYTKLWVTINNNTNEKFNNPILDGDYAVFSINNLTAGQYQFKLNGLGNQAHCSYLTEAIDNNMTLDFNCKTNVFLIMIVVHKSLFPANGYQKMRIKIDNVASSLLPTYNGKDAVFILKDIPGGNHTFELLNHAKGLACDSISKNINNSGVLKFSCYTTPN